MYQVNWVNLIERKCEREVELLPHRNKAKSQY